MTTQQEQVMISKTEQLLKLFLNGGKSKLSAENATRINCLLLELRAISDHPDTKDIPMQVFQAMGPELRRAAFDVLLGLLAASLQ